MKTKDKIRVTAAEMKFIIAKAKYTWWTMKTKTLRELRTEGILDETLVYETSWIPHRILTECRDTEFPSEQWVLFRFTGVIF
jgi:hypothetical protein